MFCKVTNCRYPNTHTTFGHKCGKCGEFGHGMIECDIYNLKSNLQVFIYDSLPQNLRCTIPGCNVPYYHSNEAHHCPKCEVRTSHSRQNCPIKAIDLHRYPDIYAKLNNYDNVYFGVDAGMGCSEYIRKKSGVIEMLFMHSDNWGQYGNDTDHSSIYMSFKKDLTQIYDPYSDNNNQTIYFDYNPSQINDDDVNENDNLINCPLCRTENPQSSIKKIKGLSEKCSICYDNDVSIYLSKCEHACLCESCLNKL